MMVSMREFGSAMKFLKPRWPKTESIRQAAVDRLGIGRRPQHAIDPMLKEVANLFAVKSAIASIIDGDRMFVCSRYNSGLEEVERNISFCGHTILQPDKVMIVWNAATDARFAGNPLVRAAPNIRFYAGAPILDADGQPIGALCAIDDLAHYQALPDQIAGLKELARKVGLALAGGGASQH